MRLDETTVWVIHAGRRGRDAPAFESAGVVGLSLPPVAGLVGMSRSDAMDAVEHALAAKNPIGASSARNRTFAAILLRFVHGIQIGDHVVTPDPASHEVLCGVIAGQYELIENPQVPGYYHVHAVTWLGRLPRSDLSQQVLRSIGAPSPLYQPAAQAQLAALPVWRGRAH